MQINVVKADQHTAIRLQGRFDFNTHRDFRASVESALQESPTQLQVDLGGVDYLDSSALGMLLMLLCWATYLANWVSFAFLPGFVIYLDYFQITPDERALASMFGQEFAAYRSKVRRWS